MKIDYDLYDYKITIKFALEKKWSEEELLLADQFLYCYQRFTSLQKRIWKVMVSHARKYELVFFERKTIAEWAGCSLRTVSNALQLFDACRFLQRKRRYNQSSIYSVLRILIDIDVDRPGCFDRIHTSTIHDRPYLVQNVNSEQDKNSCEQPIMPESVPPVLPLNNINPPTHMRNVSDRPLFVNKSGEGFRNMFGYSIELKDMFMLSDKDKRILSHYGDDIIKRAVQDILNYSQVATVFNWGAFLTERCQVYCLCKQHNISPHMARKLYIQQKEALKAKRIA